MSIGFNYIPGNIVAPIISFEVNSGGQFESVSRLLLIGHANTGSSMTMDYPIRCNSVTTAIKKAGKGSMLAEMLIAARQNATAQDIWLLPVAAEGTASTWTITIDSVPSDGGYAVVQIAGGEVSLTISAGDDVEAAAAALSAAINAWQDSLTKSALPVTAAVDGAVVTLTARWAGAITADMDIYVPTLTTGNAFDGRVTAALAAAGTGTPDLGAGLAALGDEAFDWIASPWADAANMARYQSALSDTAGRWAWNRQSYGHVYVPKTASEDALTTFGESYDTRHISTLARLADGGDATPAWVWVAALVARITPWLSDGDTGNVSRNQTGLVVEAAEAPRDSSAWMNDYATRNAFLTSGLSTYRVKSDGSVAIDKIITMQRTDGAGNVDTTFRDIQKIGQLVYALRKFRARLQAEHGQKAIADDNPGNLSAITTTKDILNTFIATAKSMPGVLENIDELAEKLQVVRSTDNPNRVNIYAPLDMINPLDVMAANATIYSQYQEAA